MLARLTRAPGLGTRVLGTIIPYVISGFVLTACPSCRPQTQQVHYGPWMPLKDNGSSGIQIAFKLYPDGTMFYKLKNTYPYTAKIDCQFTFTDRKGKSATEKACSTTLAPGQERTNGGWWEADVASVDTSTLGAKVQPAEGPQNNRNPAGLVTSTCDLSPNDIELNCEQHRNRCDANVTSWCEVRFGKDGTPKNNENRNQFNKCVTSGLADCTSSLAACISRIRRCNVGQTCDTRTSTCTQAPPH
jgi:hypothetical protein